MKFFSKKTIGSAFLLKYALAKAGQHCLYGNYDQFCSSFMVSDPVVSKLVGSLGQEKLEGIVVSEVERRVLLSLRATKMQDVEALASGQDEVQNVADCELLCREIPCRPFVRKKHGQWSFGHLAVKTGFGRENGIWP